MILMSLFEILSEVKSIWKKPKQVLALNSIANIENTACILNCANQYIVNNIFTNKMIGKVNPKNANIQKWSGEIYLEAIEPIRLIINK